MIFEFVDDSCDKDLSDINGLSAIFQRLALPMPAEEHVQYTRENGLNLFLNSYGMVLRFYPYANGVSKRFENNLFFIDHIYHERVLPYIGCVRFPQFTMQLMPAIALCDCSEHSGSLKRDFKASLDNNVDAGMSNIGYRALAPHQPEYSILLDTVHHPNYLGRKYTDYLKTQQDKIVHNFDYYDDLQQIFFETWSESRADDNVLMQLFWNEILFIKANTNRLVAGWLDGHGSEFERLIDDKGDFVAQSKAYDQLLQAQIKTL